MSNSQQRRVTIWVAIVQAAFTALVALCTGWWAYNTQRAEQARLAARDDEQRFRIEEQQALERRASQNEAIAQMSRQLGLMEAQCDSQWQLRTLLDQGPLTQRKQNCYAAYIAARSLLFLSEVRILPASTVSEGTWEALWASLDTTLRQQGTMAYSPGSVSDVWEQIINQSR